MTTGVYKITNLVNGKVYIGASKNIERRWCEHRGSVNSPIHSDLEALGEENFKFEILLECPETMLAQWERDMICLYDADDPEKGYNSPKDRPYNPKVSERMKGKNKYPRTDYQKQRVSESHKGIPRSDETRRKISETLKGKPSPLKGVPRSEEVKRKISEAHKGIPRSDETRRKISKSHKGKSLSEETRHKLSESHKGKPSPKKGISHSDESKRKISEACKGHTVSEETKRKISEAIRLYWQKKKESICS